jgi:hypothetical protein
VPTGENGSIRPIKNVSDEDKEKPTNAIERRNEEQISPKNANRTKRASASTGHDRLKPVGNSGDCRLS